nr:MAG TPA: hypothetical protein [Caudoviricetes sp.]
MSISLISSGFFLLFVHYYYCHTLLEFSVIFTFTSFLFIDFLEYKELFLNLCLSLCCLQQNNL